MGLHLTEAATVVHGFLRKNFSEHVHVPHFPREFCNDSLGHSLINAESSRAAGLATAIASGLRRNQCMGHKLDKLIYISKPG